MSEVKANRKANFSACKEPGDFFISPPNEHDGGCMRLSFLCPCGCGALAGVRIRSDGKRVDKPYGTWAWDLNEDIPTIDPSIAIGAGGSHWHGYLKNGVFKSC